MEKKGRPQAHGTRGAPVPWCVRALLLLLAPLACATQRGEWGSTGDKASTFWIDAEMRMWREEEREPVVVRPPAFRESGRLMMEVAGGEGCRPVIELWAWVGTVYRIEQKDCKLTCKVVQLNAKGFETYDRCGEKTFASLAERKQKREEIVEKPPRFDSSWTRPLSELLEAAGLSLGTDGTRYWLHEVRVASVGSSSGLLPGDMIDYVRCTPAWYYNGYGSAPRSLRMNQVALQTAVSKEAPIKLRVRRAGRTQWIALNRSPPRRR